MGICHIYYFYHLDIPWSASSETGDIGLGLAIIKPVVMRCRKTLQMQSTQGLWNISSIEFSF